MRLDGSFERCLNRVCYRPVVPLLSKSELGGEKEDRGIASGNNYARMSSIALYLSLCLLIIMGAYGECLSCMSSRCLSLGRLTPHPPYHACSSSYSLLSLWDI